VALTPAQPPQDPADELLARAARSLREEPQPGWVQISQRVVSGVRSVARQTRPVDLPLGPAGGAARRPGDRLDVADLVVVALVRQALAGLDGVRPEGVEVLLDGRRLTGVVVRVAVGYGLAVDEAAARVRAATTVVLADLLGPDGSAPVDVEVVDLL
jgi:hypothetical protein